MKTKVVNDKRCLSIVNRKLYIILLFAATLFTGCKTDTPVDNPDDPSNPETPVNVIMQNVALTGIVKDASGIPLSDMKVTTGSLNATTGGDGTFTFDQAGTVDDRAVVKFEKSGYFPLTRSGDKQDEMYIEAMLYRKGNDSISLQTDFDAAKGKRLQFKGITIDFPANCMAKADGSAYSGTVRVDVLYLNSANENTGLLMPGGDLMCIAADKSKKMVLPFGMMNVVLTDNNGNALKIKDKTDIPISFPAPQGVTAATVPHWTFDEAKGVWVEDGSLTLKGNVYSGTVSHFSPIAEGESAEYFTIKIHATACGNPAAGAMISGFFTYNTYGNYLPFYWTDNNGNRAIKLPVAGSGDIAVLQVDYKEQTDWINRIPISSSDIDNTTYYISFDKDCVNLTINVTVCDKFKSDVPVYVYSAESPNIEWNAMVTNSNGNCTMQVNRGSFVKIVATYSEEKTINEFVDEDDLVFFSFNDGCDDKIPEVFAYKYTYTGVVNGITVSGTDYLSWDNYGKRWRYEGEEKQGSNVFASIDIYDHFTHLYYRFENEDGNPNWLEAAKNSNNWSSVTFEENSKWNETLLLQGGRFTISAGYQPAPSNQYVEYSVLGGYTKRSSTETILGKVCNIWDNTSTGSVIWEWKKVIFRETVNGQVTYQLSKITEDVPVSAFTNQTVVPIWIE